MVKVSTLFHRVDGFDESGTFSSSPNLLDQDLGDKFLEDLLGPVLVDPGDKLVNAIFKQI
jgi:hypothetical protein